jgi:hypothetical protein
MWSPKWLMWRAVAQTGELRFHQKNVWRRSPEFMKQTAALLGWWGYSPKDFDGRLVVDIGAGSRLRSRYFEGARIVAIEPLADRFVSTIEWSDLREATELQSVPAEQFIEHLEGQASLVMCINVLDHVFDPGKVVGNAVRYLEAERDFLLSIDLHAPGEAGRMHPVHLDRDGLRQMLGAAGFSIEREFDGLEPIGASSYGHGRAYTVIARRHASPQQS